MIKPDAVQNGHIGPIIEKINASGFKIIALKLTKLSTADAEQFYSIHEGKPFFERLIAFMSSGPIVAAVLEKENAVEDFRTLIGATNPENAADGTLRKLYATSLSYNAIHGADSNENAAIESAFHFSDTECY
jgi:nucleoside-diphosphate kinase